MRLAPTLRLKPVFLSPYFSVIFVLLAVKRDKASPVSYNLSLSLCQGIDPEIDIFAASGLVSETGIIAASGLVPGTGIIAVSGC